MGMIDRYKKSGGFLQLVHLIETCGPAKQEKFLSIIHSEDPKWSAAIQQKMLSMDRILSWPDDTLAEIFNQMNELTMAMSFHGMGKEVQDRMFAYMSHGQQRRITDHMSSKTPTEGEVSAAYIKVIEEVRNLMKSGSIRVENFDPTLVIDEEIEEKLAQGYEFGPAYEPSSGVSVAQKSAATPPPDPQPQAAPSNSNGAAGGNGQLKAEVSNLQRKLKVLSNENAQLKGKVKTLEDKLEQIKKIA